MHNMQMSVFVKNFVSWGNPRNVIVVTASKLFTFEVRLNNNVYI